MNLTSPWADAIGSYVTYLQAGGSPMTTIATRRQHLYRVAMGLGGSPWAVETPNLLTWFSTQVWAQETRRAYRNTLRSFYKWGIHSGHTAVDASAALPTVKATPPAPRPVTDEAYRYALARADQRTRLMIRLAAEIGLRRTEVATVHSRNLIEDMTGWSLVVTGKGAKTRSCVVACPPAGRCTSCATDSRRAPTPWTATCSQSRTC